MKYDKLFKTLAIKHSIDVLLLIYLKSKTEEYPTFEYLRKELHLANSTLRRVTNALSRNKIIKSVIPNTGEDRRHRVYVICNTEVTEQIYQMCQFF